MGVLEAFVRGLTWLICGPRAPEPPADGASQEGYIPPVVPHKPSQQQRPPASTPPSYHSRPDAPPATQQQQQWHESRPENRPEHHAHHAHSPSPGRVVCARSL